MDPRHEAGDDKGRGLQHQCFVDVFPIRVSCLNEVYLPLSRPMLDVLLALYCIQNIPMFFAPHEPSDTVFVGEALWGTLSVLPRASRKIVCHAGIERSITLAGEDVDPISVLSWHRRSPAIRAPLSSPALCRGSRLHRRACPWIPGASPGMTRSRLTSIRPHP